MKLPVTRYYGSKRKLVDKIWNVLAERNIQFHSVLDLFGGSGIFSYFMLAQGKSVIYNDIFRFNCEIANALLSTLKGTFTEKDALSLLLQKPGINYLHVIEDNFSGIYYKNEENKIIDVVIQNILELPEDQRSSAYYILFQSCMIKRPFNLFHRKNLNLRINHTKSNFGNKTTWEHSFNDLFIKFARELNEVQFDLPMDVVIANQSALNCEYTADLVYIDTPYYNKEGLNIPYHTRYHFLEGLLYYKEIPLYIDYNKRNREIIINKNPEFESKKSYLEELDILIEHHRHSIIVLSYTSDGYPSIDNLTDVVRRYKGNVEIVSLGNHAFALNRHNKGREEILIIGQ